MLRHFKYSGNDYYALFDSKYKQITSSKGQNFLISN